MPSLLILFVGLSRPQLSAMTLLDRFCSYDIDDRVLVYYANHQIIARIDQLLRFPPCNHQCELDQC